MLARAWSAAVHGIDGFRVSVEADVGHGFPRFSVVGLPDAAIRESKERVISAMRNAGYAIPYERVVVNLGPADVRKEGASFDVPMAIAVLAASGICPRETLEGVGLMGELSLDGALRPVRGVLPMAMALRASGIDRVVVPPDNASEAAAVPGLRVRTADTLSDIVREDTRPANVRAATNVSDRDTPDLADVRGQLLARRALEIAAAGRHHLVLEGPPGVGKSMLARRLPGILPPLTGREAVETARVHSVAGLLGSGDPLPRRSPFRAPHHTASTAGLLGGSWPPRPGEASLAHNGVLFLDELPEFRRDALEALREPIEDAHVRVVRAGYRVRFPARFVLVGAMNPCPCGYDQHPTRMCRCRPGQVERYRAKLSGPLLDRIDLFVSLSAVRPEELQAPPGEDSAHILKRVERAHRRQRERQGVPNGRLSGQTLRRHAMLTTAASATLTDAMQRLSLSPRVHDRVLRVSRTIADLAGTIGVGVNAVTEALQYRREE